MTFAGHEIIIDLLDTPMVHAFLTQRPMTLMSEDFNGNEKNNYLQQKLSIASDIHAEETKGNFCYKSPNRLFKQHKTRNKKYSYKISHNRHIMPLRVPECLGVPENRPAFSGVFYM